MGRIMSEEELYRVCNLRCMTCEHEYTAEVECMGEMIPRKTKVFDLCPYCQEIGDSLYLGDA